MLACSANTIAKEVDVEWQKTCPICGGGKFRDFNNRALVRCENCTSLERTRLLWILLERLGLITLDATILHIAPEPGIATRLQKITGSYLAADFNPDQYKNFISNRQKVDLCNLDSKSFKEKYDLIIHMHVLEHIPCCPFTTLRKLSKHLKKGGMMLFCVPIRKGAYTEEDLNPELSPAVRKQKFGQEDHMRIFGELDTLDLLTSKFSKDVAPIQPTSIFAEQELRLYGIPQDNNLNGNTIFKYQR